MSDTPKTDANCGWPVGHHGRIECSDLRWSPDGPFVHSSVARELERENAALRADKARLDWLERRTVSRLQAVLDHVELHKLPIREAIDLAIEEIGQ